MILTENVIKDTYVTNIKTLFNDGLLSNVGQAATLDFFKICNENRKINSQALLVLEQLPQQGSTFTLVDSHGKEVIFEFISQTNDNKKIDIVTNQNGEIVKSLTATNIVNEINSVLNFKIEAYKLYDDAILLKQKEIGESGDTEIAYTAGTGIKYYSFKRIENSAILIELDLDSFKQKNISSIENSVFSIDNNQSKFLLKLFDVGTSSTKPFDFKIKINALKSSFEEGTGKDTIHFSDYGSSNFTFIDEKNNTQWNIPGIVSSDDILDKSILDEEFYFSESDNDLKIDITEYVKNYLNNTPGYDSKTFVIHFDLESLFDNFTYFVKRFASRNVNNKFFVPRLDAMIKDFAIENISATDKKRYINNSEVFYLCNIQGNTLKDFLKNEQNEYVDVKLRLSYINSLGENIFSLNEDHIQEGHIVYNYKGQLLEGIRKFEIPESLVSILQEDEDFKKELNQKEKVNINFEYFYDIGGTETVIRLETYPFYKTTNQTKLYSLSKSSIRCSISKLSEKIFADNSVKKFKISFIDIYKQYDTVSIPYDLISEDLGKVSYSMFDIDSGKEIISEDEEYTNLFYDGINYIMSFYSSENFKNRRVNFIFYYSDPITGLKNKIINDNNIIRFE